MWLELVAHGRRITLRGRAVELFTPFQVVGSMQVGAHEELALEGGQACRLLAHETTLEVAAERLGRHELQAGQTLDLGAAMLRVIGPKPEGTCGWPADVSPTLVPHDDHGLSVLGDQLLERGHAVGARFIARNQAEDASWLGAFPVSAVRSWRLGVVDSFRLDDLQTWSSWGTVVALRRTAVTSVMRDLTLAVHEFNAVHLIEALAAQGGLPWLERLEVIVGGLDLRGHTDLERALAELEGVQPKLTARPRLTVVPRPSR
jgi:hypothetical protein